MTIVKLKLDWQHILFVLLAVLCAGILAAQQAVALPKQTGLAAYVGYLAIAGFFLTSLASLLKRSPSDNWKLLTGLLATVEQEPPTKGPGASAYRVWTQSIRGFEVKEEPPTPPVSKRTRFAPYFPFDAVFVGGCVGIILVVATIAMASACTPAKVATAKGLADTAACVFTQIDEGQTPEQAATTCNVGVNDVFDLVSLFDKRAAKGPIALPDGGVDAGGQ